MENFYWIIYNNLLRPLEIDSYYYYPFGTKDNLIQTEFHQWNPNREHHVLFGFDQEPLWNDDLGIHYHMNPDTWSVKLLRILANSEWSAIKKKICRERGLLDWYFFYHGFAALDWYQDALYITTDHEVQKAFLSFNHLVCNQRSYRLALISKLLDLNVETAEKISLHAGIDDIVNELMDPNTALSSSSIQSITRNLSQFANAPWMLDHLPVDGLMSAHFGHKELLLWQQSLLHVVNETVFYESKLHLTEKTFKPIVACRPFVLVAAPGNLAYLKTYGFQTFDHWIDESYDTILDNDLRLNAIAQQIAKFAAMPVSELRRLYREMRPILEHNKRHFFQEFRHQLVHELVDNFENCIKSWNHARLDNRAMSMVPNFTFVKNLLLG